MSKQVVSKVSVSGKGSTPKGATAKRAEFFGVAYGGDCPRSVGDVFKIQVADLGIVESWNPREASFGDPCADMEAVETIDPKTGLESWGKVSASQLADGVSRLLRKGWDYAKENVQVFWIGDNPELQKLVVADRARIHDEMVKAGKGELAYAYKLLYAGHDAPQYLAVTCNRRLRAVAAVVALRIREGVASPCDFEVSAVLEPKPADEKARLLRAVEENYDMGRKYQTSQDVLAFVYRLLKLDPNLSQNDLLKRGIKKGEVQRCHNLARLAINFPQLDLINRLCFMPQPGEKDVKGGPGCYIPLTKIDHTAATRLAAGRLPNSKGEGPETLIPDMSAEWLEENYFQQLATGDRGVSRFTIADLGKLLASHPCKLLQQLNYAINQGEAPAFLAGLIPMSEVLNRVMGHPTTPSEIMAAQAAKSETTSD